MRLRPRGIRARSTIAAVFATAVVVAVFGFASAVIVHRTATSAVREVVDSRLDQVVAQVLSSDELDPTSAAIEAVGPGNRVFVQVMDPSGGLVVQSRGLPEGRTPCSPGAEFLVSRADVATQSSLLTVCAAASLESVEGSVRSVTIVMAILGPIVLLGVGVAVWLSLGSALRSVDTLRTQAKAMGGIDDGTLIVEPTGDEVEALGLTLNELLERLHAQARALRQFVADAGHELRNPLATLRVLLELRDRSDEVNAEALVELTRLEALVQDLLTLAKSDARDAPAFEEVDVGDLVAEAVRTAARGDARVVLRRADAACMVQGDRRSLRSAVDNLLDNARRHAVTSVQVEVSRQGPNVVVAVNDDGAGIASADVEHVFERFVRLDESRVRDQGGSGLGLAIVRATMAVHGGRAWALPGPGGHLIISLPCAKGSAMALVESSGEDRDGQ